MYHRANVTGRLLQKPPTAPLACTGVHKDMLLQGVLSFGLLLALCQAAAPRLRRASNGGVGGFRVVDIL